MKKQEKKQFWKFDQSLIMKSDLKIFFLIRQLFEFKISEKKK